MSMMSTVGLYFSPVTPFFVCGLTVAIYLNCVKTCDTVAMIS